MTGADNTADNSKKRVVGRPFVKGDPRINRKGAPVRGQSWAETIKRLTDMTREEAVAYVGAKTELGRKLSELPPNVPIKDALILASIIAYGREPNARMLQALSDREDGKPAQSVDVTSGGKPIGWKEFIERDTDPGEDSGKS